MSTTAHDNAFTARKSFGEPLLTANTQRGGAGNIDSPKVKPTKPGSTHDSDVIPETAVHEAGSEHQTYHVGRGGEGNAHHDPDSTATHKGLADKLKDKIFGKK